MAEVGEVDVIVEPLRRELLDGIDDGGAPRSVDVAVLPWFEDERPLQGLAGLVDWRMGGRLSTLVREGFCRGHAEESVLLPGHRTLPMRRLVLLGLGSSSSFDREAAESTGERVVDLLDRLRATDAIVAMPGRVGDRTLVEALFDGLTRALSGPTVEAAARPKAVGDEASGPIMVGSGTDVSRGGSSGTEGDRPVKEERAPLEVAPEPDSGPDGPGSDDPGPSDPPVSATPIAEPAAEPEPTEPARRRLWVVADPRHEARLNRLLDGPPRAAESGS